jgi:hypothetical protein
MIQRPAHSLLPNRMWATRQKPALMLLIPPALTVLSKLDATLVSPFSFSEGLVGLDKKFTLFQIFI